LNGRIDLPVDIQTVNISPSQMGLYTVAGATSNGSTLYTLLSSGFPSKKSILVANDAHSGAYLGQIQLSVRLSDIAYTNGQLYGTINGSNQLQIDTIAANGATQSIFSQAAVSSGNWRLSGVSSGNTLLAADNSSTLSGGTGFVINPSTLQISQIAIAPSRGPLAETVINSAGNSFTAITDIDQNVASFPGGVAQGTRSASTTYGSSFIENVVSDEFNYTYLASMPAVARTAWQPTVSAVGSFDGLIRLPQQVTVSAPITINNHIAPDGVTMSNVVPTNVSVNAYGLGGSDIISVPYTYSVQSDAPGDLSDRVIAQASATVDLTNAPKGTYYALTDILLDGDYSYGSTTDHDRPIQTDNSNALVGFAYDPVSSNLVGNGDASLQGAGWEESIYTPAFTTGVFTRASAKSFALIPAANEPSALRQTLQLPTPGTPMLLSFTYFLELFPNASPDDIQVFLNGVELADLTVSSGSVQTFQTLVTDPALENLSNASLMFRATTTDPSESFVDVGNISLTGVPEPASGGLVVFAAAALCCRRIRGTREKPGEARG
jgi:hypothetical protein